MNTFWNRRMILVAIAAVAVLGTSVPSAHSASGYGRGATVNFVGTLTTSGALGLPSDAPSTVEFTYSATACVAEGMAGMGSAPPLSGTFTVGAGACSVTASGTITGSCGLMTGTGTSTVTVAGAANASTTDPVTSTPGTPITTTTSMSFVGLGATMVITGTGSSAGATSNVAGVAAVVPDPTAGGSCLTKTATNFTMAAKKRKTTVYFNNS